MSASVFGFSDDPFPTLPVPECWSATSDLKQAFEAVTHCLSSGRGIAILTGPAGIGKTLFCQRVAEQLCPEFRVAFLQGGRFDGVAAFLQTVLFELQKPYQRLGTQELRLQLTAAVRDSGTRSKGVLLILDEAEALGEEILQEVRAVTNLHSGGRPLVRVLLSGQYSLEELLTSPNLDSLNQRIGCHVSVEPLTRSDSADYVAYRLHRVGIELASVLTADALQTICFAADGNPRCLNRLCDLSFELAGKAGRQQVDETTVRRALDELKQLPLHWNDPPQSSTDDSLDTFDVLEEPMTMAESVETSSSAGPYDSPDGDKAAVGETAVFEFGGEETPVDQHVVNEFEEESPVVAPVETMIAKRPATSESVDGFVGEIPDVRPLPDGSQPEWTSVDPFVRSRRENPIEPPPICFGESPGTTASRIEHAPMQARSTTAGLQPTRDEPVEDRYASLLAEQQSRPVKSRSVLRPEPASRVSSEHSVADSAAEASPVLQPATEIPPCRDSATLQEQSTHESLDSLLSFVNEATRDLESEMMDRSDEATQEPKPPEPIQSVEVEPTFDRFHSIEDYLTAAGRDVVCGTEDDHYGPAPHFDSAKNPNQMGSSLNSAPTRSGSPLQDVDLISKLNRIRSLRRDGDRL